MRFLNRETELKLLTDRLATGSAELLVVYGRRRIGKTELLARIAATSRSLYYEATATVMTDQLRDLSDELVRVSGDELLAMQPVTSWNAALAAVARFVGDTRTLVVLDEFQLLAAQAPELESTLSRWWRNTGRHLPIMLVLAGSELSFFENSVLAGQLYGRRTGQLRLAPLRARDAALFHPGYGPEDRIRAYAVCGGIPYYLERFTDQRPLADQLLREVFLRTGLLHQEVELMLRQSIRDPTSHIAVLRSIAAGHNRNSMVVERTQLAPASVTKILDSLERLELVERLRPATASPRGKRIAYAIRDQFLRFHFRFLEPARSQLRTAELAETYLQATVLPQLDHHTSLAWEDVCREHVLHTAAGVTAVGRWWGPVPTGEGRRTEQREVDVVGVDGARRALVVGMCKWTRRPVDVDELNLLDWLVPYIDGRVAELDRYLFSRSGFTDRLAARANVDDKLHLVTPTDLYR